MRHRTGSQRQRPHIAARLPLYALILGLQLSVGASLMGGAGAAVSPVPAGPTTADVRERPVPAPGAAAAPTTKATPHETPSAVVAVPAGTPSAPTAARFRIPGPA
ncbi:MAG: hypothetical protein ABIM89_10760, partial [Mycobacteriales bacterium]